MTKKITDMSELTGGDDCSIIAWGDENGNLVEVTKPDLEEYTGPELYNPLDPDCKVPDPDEGKEGEYIVEEGESDIKNGLIARYHIKKRGEL